MHERRFFAEAFALVACAALCAGVANYLAASHRKLAPIGDYPNATTLPTPAAAPGTAPAASGAAAPTSTAPTAAAPPVVMTAEEVLAAFPPHPDKAWFEIGSDDALKLHSAKMLFLDARRSTVFAEGHIAGAQSFPVWESEILDPKLDELASELLGGARDSNTPIVIYCTGGNCEDSHMLADKLFQKGYNNLLVYKDGFPDWQGKGRPIATGA